MGINTVTERPAVAVKAAQAEPRKSPPKESSEPTPESKEVNKKEESEKTSRKLAEA